MVTCPSSSLYFATCFDKSENVSPLIFAVGTELVVLDNSCNDLTESIYFVKSSAEPVCIVGIFADTLERDFVSADITLITSPSSFRYLVA